MSGYCSTCVLSMAKWFKNLLKVNLYRILSKNFIFFFYHLRFIEWKWPLWGGPHYMRPFYLQFRVCAIEKWPFSWNLSSNLQLSLVFLYANSLYASLFFESLSLAYNEVHLYLTMDKPVLLSCHLLIWQTVRRVVTLIKKNQGFRLNLVENREIIILGYFWPLQWWAIIFGAICSLTEFGLNHLVIKPCNWARSSLST